jgi:hypothetical protein
MVNPSFGTTSLSSVFTVTSANLRRATISRTFFWSDSMTTLQYIKDERRRFRPFVANRLSEIPDVSSPSDWRHVPVDLNPVNDG